MKLSVIAAAIVAAIVIPARDARAGASCFDACTGPAGQIACGSGGLGCPPGGGQCIQCRDDNDCQPGGNCVTGVCINLPCSPDAGGMPPADAGEVDGSEDSGMAAPPPMDASVTDAATSTRADAGGSQAGTGAKPGSSDRSGCDCSTTTRDHGAAGIIFALVFFVIRRKLNTVRLIRGHRRRTGKCRLGTQEPRRRFLFPGFLGS